jgi:hypothetical protein
MADAPKPAGDKPADGGKKGGGIPWGAPWFIVTVVLSLVVSGYCLVDLARNISQNQLDIYVAMSIVGKFVSGIVICAIAGVVIKNMSGGGH